SLLHFATNGNHPRRIRIERRAIMIAVHLVNLKPVALQEDLQLAREDESQIELALLPMLAAAPIEPPVVEGNPLNLPARIAANVHVHVNGALQARHIEHRRFDGFRLGIGQESEVRLKDVDPEAPARLEMLADDRQQPVLLLERREAEKRVEE